jgi:hypothetical protein
MEIVGTDGDHAWVEWLQGRWWDHLTHAILQRGGNA